LNVEYILSPYQILVNLTFGIISIFGFKKMLNHQINLGLFLGAFIGLLTSSYLVFYLNLPKKEIIMILFTFIGSIFGYFYFKKMEKFIIIYLSSIFGSILIGTSFEYFEGYSINIILLSFIFFFFHLWMNCLD